MITPLPFQPDRFSTAAPHYLAGRTPYPPVLIRRVAERTGLAADHRVLDLGCGPGPLAIAFAPLAHDVVAVDPEPAMLAAGRDAAAACPNIRFIQGSSYDLGPALGAFFLVTMGRSFHWMDRADTLRRLDTMIAPDGAIALFHDSRPDVPDNAWRAEVNAVIARYAPREKPRGGWLSNGWVRHEGVLIDSPFPRMETVGVIERHDVPIENLIDRVLSMSTTSPAKLGDATNALVEELRETLTRLAPTGTLPQLTETTALMAWRA